MKAIRIRGKGGAEALELVDVAEPGKAPAQVRIAVHASALNRADLIQARGHYPAPPGVPSDIPGLEFSGTVLESDSAGTWKAGDAVMGLVGGGAFAEQLVTEASALMRVPSKLSLLEAAALPEAFITAHDALFTQGGLSNGGRALIHAVGSGVGTAGLQLAHLVGAKVAGTSRSQWKLERCVSAFGLDCPVLTAGDGPPHFAKAVTDALGEVDVVLDLVGGAYVEDSLVCLRRQGTLMLVGLLAGNQTDVNLGRVLQKRLRLIGTTLRSRTVEEKSDAVARFAALALPRFETGELRTLVEDTVPMKDVGQAFTRMASNDLMGKLVLAW